MVVLEGDSGEDGVYSHHIHSKIEAKDFWAKKSAATTL
jgi:hypothetical protein